MKKVNPAVVERSALSGEEFTWIDRGIGADTWLSEDFVVQARPGDFLPRAELLFRMSGQLPLAGLSFAAQPIIEDNRTWTVQRRLNVIAELYDPSFDDQTIAANALDYGPAILDQLDCLARRGPLAEAAALPESRACWLQLIGVDQLKQWADRDCPLADSQVSKLDENEPESEVVFAHGDPILKNTVLTHAGPVLIDFEAIAALPRHKDLCHIVAFLLKRTAPELWPEIINGYWRLAKVYLPAWSRQDWLLATTIYLLRELLAWPVEDEQINQRGWRGLNQLINEIS